MERLEFVLAAMAPAGTDPYSPVQIQKLLFLLDVNVADATGGPHFNFEPYDYGPFDKQVYRELDALGSDNLVEIGPSIGLKTKTFRLTCDGEALGQEALCALSPPIQTYIKEASDFVRSLSFSQLVSAIYAAYPDMSVNSVFSKARQ